MRTAHARLTALPLDALPLSTDDDDRAPAQLLPPSWAAEPFFKGLAPLAGVPVINLQLWLDRPLGSSLDGLAFSRSPLLSVYADMSKSCHGAPAQQRRGGPPRRGAKTASDAAQRNATQPNAAPAAEASLPTILASAPGTRAHTLAHAHAHATRWPSCGLCACSAEYADPTGAGRAVLELVFAPASRSAGATRDWLKASDEEVRAARAVALASRRRASRAGHACPAPAGPVSCPARPRRGSATPGPQRQTRRE
jgi:hypothetical protein